MCWNMLEDASFLLHSQDFELDWFLVAGWDTKPCHVRWRQASLVPALGAQQKKKAPSNFKIRRRYLCLIYSYLISSLTSREKKHMEAENHQLSGENLARIPASWSPVVSSSWWCHCKEQVSWCKKDWFARLVGWFASLPGWHKGYVFLLFDGWRQESLLDS